MEYNWTMFFSDFAEGFHPSFEKQISQQLWDKGEQTGIKQFQKYNFQLIIGMAPLNLDVQDKRVIITVEFITPTSFSFPVQISWFMKGNICDLKNFHKSEVTEDMVDINWEKNFPIDKVLEHISPYRRTKADKNQIGIDVDYFHFSLPDIELQLFFKSNPTDGQLKQINDSLMKFWENWNQRKKDKPIEFISGVNSESDRFIIVIDTGIKNTSRMINELLKELGGLYSEIINKIEVK